MRRCLRVAFILALALIPLTAEATCFLKQSTALATGIRLGPFVDQTDGFTAEGGLTLSQADVRLSKGEGAFAQKNDATACTHLENGYYKCPIDATDTNTLGQLLIAVNESGALPVWKECVVLTATNYEALIGTGTAFDANGAIKVQSGTGSNQISLSSGAVIVQAGTGTGQVDLSSGRIKDDKPAVGRIALKKGISSYIGTVYIEDQRTGGPLTGLVFNTASLSAYYTRADQGNAGATVINLVTATRGSYTSSGFVEKDATNTPGWYEVGFPNAMFDIGSPWVTLTLKGAANMKPATVFVELLDAISSDITTVIGTPAGASVSVDIAAVKTETASIQADTNDIQTRLPASLLNGRMDTVTASVYRKNIGGQRGFQIWVDNTDGTPYVGAAGTVTVQVSKDGGAWGAVTGTVSGGGGSSFGLFLFSPSASDVNCDACAFRATASGARASRINVTTQP